MNRIKLLVQILVLFEIMIHTEAFLVDHVSYPELPVTDYTLRKLTEETMVRVVASYFEESNPGKYNPGDLLNLEPLTASSLFQGHFGDCVSSSDFMSAVREVTKGNLDIERNFNAISNWHFNAEQIHQSNKRMKSLRRTILASLNNPEPDYAVVRENIGKYLHLLQSFYSNTNWVELYPDGVNLNSDLGLRKLTDPVVTPQDTPCKSCRNVPMAGRPEAHDCRSSLNYNRRFISLYSGYRSGQDIAKPAASGISWGKCSHGGKFDDTWTQVATGGINKESSHPAISPHHHLHQTAAQLAIRAGVAFFNDQDTGIKSLISNTKFQQLLNLDSGRSIVFVVDDTGSMADEIDAALNTATLLVNQFGASCQTSKQCIVSPFNDPGIGPLTNSDNPQVCANALADLYAHGGDDCPELAMSGLEAALEQIVYPAKVYLWTDASAKDDHKRDQVLQLAEQKNAEITFFLTGECGRRKRSARSTDLYSQLSSATGGAVYHATDYDISSISNIVLAESSASEVAILHWSKDDFTNVLLSVPVDNTMEKLTVKVSGPSPKLNLQLIDPSGSTVSYETSNNEILVDTSNLLIFIVHTSAPGNWSLRLDHVTSGNAYQVDITASSFLDFVYQMMEFGPGGLLVPVEGNPLAGSNVTFVIDIISPDLHQYANELLLHDSEGRTVLLRAPLNDVAGPALGIYTANVILPEQVFTVSIIGTDELGDKIQRLHMEAVEVLGFTLTISNNTAGNLAAGESGSFQLHLSNTGADDTFDLNVNVMTRSSALTNPVTASVTPSNVDLESGSTASGAVTLIANQAANAGDSILVTVNMISRKSGERNFVSYSVTLAEQVEIDVPQEDDLTPPSCTIIRTENSCTPEQIQLNCASHFWGLRANLQDNRAISLITVTDFEISNSSYTLERSNAGNVEVVYESNCCCPNITISVQDTSGNVDRCELDHLVLVDGIDNGQCVRDCDEATECYNEGLCFGGRCECVPGFNGTLCENNIDECATDPCLHDASCHDGIQTYFCNCTDTGYTGFHCEIDEVDCLQDSCKNHGQCIDEFKGFSCNCDGTGFEGATCEIDMNECENDVCLNNGSCTNMHGTFTCDCYPGWMGIVCDLNVNECESGILCINNATCQDTPGSYICACPEGYQGNYCEIEINECDSHPCQHEGLCTDLIGQYSCQCSNGYHGDDCQLDVNECADTTLNNCHANATCHNTEGSFECQCEAGFEGDGLQCSDLNECENNNDNCHAYATCHNTVGSFECTCSVGFEGDGVLCSDINECENSTANNCHSNATCMNTPGSYECFCEAGFEGNGINCSDCRVGRYGLNCSEICTCVSGASCNRVDGNCTCDKVFVNQTCDRANLKVSVTVQNTTINAADNITLTCKVNLPATDIGNMVTWVLPDQTTKNISHNVPDDNGSDPDYNGMYELNLLGTHNASDAGRYTCIARTDLQTKILQADAYIDIGIQESTGGAMLLSTSICGFILAFILSTFIVHH